MITVTPAETTARDAARELLQRLRVTQPLITQVWADSAYGGQLINRSGNFLNMTLLPTVSDTDFQTDAHRGAANGRKQSEHRAEVWPTHTAASEVPISHALWLCPQ